MLFSNPFEPLALHLLTLTKTIRASSNPSIKIDKTLLDLFNQAVSKAYDTRQFRIQDEIWQLNPVLEKNLDNIDRAKQRRIYEENLKKELAGSVEIPDPYLKDFDQKIRGKSEKEKTDSRHLILRFLESTEFFWPYVMKDHPGQLSFRAALQFPSEGIKNCLLDRPLFKALKKEGDWTKVETILEQDIPIACLAKIKNPVLLTVREEETLKNWLKALNRCQHKITPRQLFHILTEVVSICHIQGSSSLTVSDLLLWLDKEGCPLLYAEDDSHMDWREHLKSGSKVTCNGRELVLGEMLSPQKEAGQKDDYKIFALQGHPDKVIKIACNRFLLLLEAIKSKNPEFHWGIHFVECKEDSDLDQRGRCVVLERLSPLFEEKMWKSDAIQLEKEEERLALIFANHLSFFRQTRTSIGHLSLVHLMRDAEGKLKSTRLLNRGSAHYREWEFFCLHLAKGNEFVLRFLIEVSDLPKSEMAFHYREGVQEIFRTKKTTVIKKTLPLDHQHKEEERSVKEIGKEAKQLREECLNAIIGRLRSEGKYSHTGKEEVEEKMIASLLAVYKASSTSAYFSPSFKQRVIDHYFSSSLPPLIDAQAQAYYRKQSQLLNQYNQQAAAST